VEDVTVLQESFHLGACDFLVKPFSQAELLVKVNRCAERQLAKLRDIELDPAGHCARVEGHPSVALTAREFQITAILREAQQGLKREELTLRVWESTHVTEKALDVLLFKLRRKLRVLGWDILFNNDGRYTLSSNRMKD
jgi:DNA-binding response OmpR family regulator